MTKIKLKVKRFAMGNPGEAGGRLLLDVTGGNLLIDRLEYVIRETLHPLAKVGLPDGKTEAVGFVPPKTDRGNNA